MTREDILHHFQDINFYYGDCMMYADLSGMLDELIAENKDGWIPIEERKPNEYDDVLVSTDIEEVFEATYYGDELGFDDNNGNFYEGEVIAWQPKPKPYKAESEGAE